MAMETETETKPANPSGLTPTLNPKALALVDVLTKHDLQLGWVECPEWGGRVYLRTISGNDRDKLDASFANHDGDPEKLEGYRATVVGLSWCDENAVPTSPDAATIYELGTKSAVALDRCYDKCVGLSKLGGDAVEETVKNSTSE